MRTRTAEVLVVGGGPAGMAAAAAAARVSKNVVLLDDNRRPGGQIWRAGFLEGQGEPAGEERRRRRALEELRRCGAEILVAHRVFQAAGPEAVDALFEGGVRPEVVRFRATSLVLATGARERFLPFPGWTLPGVYGAGGLQALVRGGLPVAGKRVVVAGSGPLLVAVAAHLRAAGASVPVVAEQASRRTLVRFAPALVQEPSKLLQGARYRALLWGTAYRAGVWPVHATAAGNGEALLRAVRLTDGRRTWEEPCDLLACGFGLVPNLELAQLLGCTLRDGFVDVDARQQTSVRGVFCAGEPTGIGGQDAAQTQGTIAGLAAAGLTAADRRLQRQAARQRRFTRALAVAFAPRPELRALAGDSTVVCRCEDVPLGRVRAYPGWTESKLQTRCGMGACQGRVCGPALEVLLGWAPGSVRPPIFPVPVEALCAAGTPADDAGPHWPDPSSAGEDEQKRFDSVTKEVA